MKKFWFSVAAVCLISCGNNHKSMPQIKNTGPSVVQPQKTEISYLALGDSYTKGESVEWTSNFPNQLVSKLKDSNIVVEKITVIAETGWRTDDLSEAIANQNPENHDIVSLLIGVNNYFQGKSPQSFEPEFEELLLTAIKLANGNNKKVFVLSIPDYGYTPYGESRQPAISSGIDLYNEICKDICQKHAVKYFYITDITRDGLTSPELVASDGLHPSALAYNKFTELMLQDVVELIHR